MKYILFTWILSVLVGSIIGPLVVAGSIKEIWGTIFLCLIISGLWSLPLIITEVITWELIKRQLNFNSWVRYSWIKYCVAILTVIAVGFESLSGFKWAMSLLVCAFYGVPGLLLHVFYLRKKLQAQRNGYTAAQLQTETE